jgi:hypothetical protein
MRPLLRLFVLLMLVPAALPAERLSTKYRSWDKSPEAYFLTSEERAQWKRIQADADAGSSSPTISRAADDFPAMLKDASPLRDKYFSAGKVKGSETLRERSSSSSGLRPGSTNPRRRLDGEPPGRRRRKYASSGVPNPYSNVGAGAAGLAFRAGRTIQFRLRQAPGSRRHRQSRSGSRSSSAPATISSLSIRRDSKRSLKPSRRLRSRARCQVSGIRCQVGPRSLAPDTWPLIPAFPLTPFP